MPGSLQRAGRHRRLVLLGGGALLLVAVACMLGAELAPSPTQQQLLEPTSGPSAAHWFGTDELSRDVLARVLHGGRISLRVGLGVALVSTALGTVIGLVAGMAGGLVDSLLMRGTDLWLALPGLPVLAVAVQIGSADLGVGTLDLGSPLGITLVLSLLLWGPVARVVRACARSLCEQDFVLAAKAMNASPWRLATRHVLPNSTGPIVVAATLAVAQAILVESTLSFLGFGIQPPTASWGSLLAGSVGSIEEHWWLTVFPGVAIFVTVLAVGIVGEGLRSTLDPRAELRR